MDKFKEVEKDEFDKFIDNYINKLDYDVVGFSEPPCGSHHDFSGGKRWPESQVTRVKLYEGHEYYGGMKTEYYIRKHT